MINALSILNIKVSGSASLVREREREKERERELLSSVHYFLRLLITDHLSD